MKNPRFDPAEPTGTKGLSLSLSLSLSLCLCQESKKTYEERGILCTATA